METVRIASFEGVIYVSAALAGQLSGRCLSHQEVAELNTRLGWAATGSVFAGLETAHIAPDPNDSSRGQQQCFLVVNLILTEEGIAPEQCPLPEDLIQEIAARLCPEVVSADDWECVDVEVTERWGDPTLFSVLLPWAHDGDPSDEEGTYMTTVWAGSETHAIRLVAEEMADSGEKHFFDRAARRAYIKSRSECFSDVVDVILRVRADLDEIFRGSSKLGGEAAEELRAEFVALMKPETDAPQPQRPRG
jgi:hypothetical protein